MTWHDGIAERAGALRARKSKQGLFVAFCAFDMCLQNVIRTKKKLSENARFSANASFRCRSEVLLPCKEKRTLLLSLAL